MIDVDVVKDVDEDYALSLRGEISRELDCFVVAHLSSDGEQYVLAQPLRQHNLAVSFSQGLGEFFYEFAEAHFQFDQGDDIVLLMTKLDCNNLDESALINGFKQRAEESLSVGDSTILKRRKAISTDSAEFSGRIRRDIYSHRLLKDRS